MNGRLVPRAEITSTEEQEMFSLLSRHFEAVSAEQFRTDLDEKNWVILLEDAAGRLQGFSTLLLYRAAPLGEQLTVAYSGDTIVDPAAWGTSVLPAIWIDSVLRLHRRQGGERLFWLLLSSGFRTYRFLSVFWREFHPRFSRATPHEAKTLMDRLAAERFGDRYDPGTGIVRFDRPQVIQRDLRCVPFSRTSDPHVTFFLHANPGHARGDELVCLTEIAGWNLMPAGRRMVRAGARRRLVLEAVP